MKVPIGSGRTVLTSRLEKLIGLILALVLVAGACSATESEEDRSGSTPATAAPETDEPDQPEPDEPSEEPSDEPAQPEPVEPSEEPSDEPAQPEAEPDDSASAEADATPTELPEDYELTASDIGVTAEAILMGHPNWDLEMIQGIGVDLGWGNVVGHYQIEVDAINAAGGVLGRQISLVPALYLPIGALGLGPCTQHTQEDQVFAAVGVFRPDITASCYARENGTPILHGASAPLETATYNQESAGIFSVFAPGDLLAIQGLSALDEQGFFDGLKIALVGRNEDHVTRFRDHLNGLGNDTSGGIAILSTGEADQVGEVEEFSLLFERWSADSVDLVINSTAGVGMMQAMFVEDFKMSVVVTTTGPVVAVVDEDATGGAGTPLQARQVFAIGGANHISLYEEGHSPTVACVDRWNTTFPDEVSLVDRGPDDLNNLEHVVMGCAAVQLFAAVAAAAGPDLTRESFAAAATGIEDLNLPGIGSASLLAQKPYAQEESYVWEWSDDEDRFVPLLAFELTQEDWQ